MPNGPDWIVAYYAIMAVGAVAVPLEHGLLEQDPGRIRYALDHSEARLLVGDPDEADLLREVAGQGRTLMTVPEARAEGAAGPAPPPDRGPDDLAQILYTSGTTGPKKGVELTHRNIIFDVAALCRRFGIYRGDALPALLPCHHAYPLTTTVVVPLYAGARIAVGDIRERRSRILLRLCRPTVLIAVPRVFESMLQSIRSTAERGAEAGRLARAERIAALAKRLTAINPGKLLFRRLHREMFGGPQLRFGISGGARISPTVLRRLFGLGIPVLQGWGMSELSPVGAVQDFRRSEFWLGRRYERKAGSIGRPLEETRIALDARAAEGLSFEGAAGEMVVSGPHVMRGYHKDPERTARLLTPRGLRSGDVARRDRDGDLCVVGRIKHVIVLPTGKKVFPEDELEEELSGCPTFEQFTVRPITDEADNERIGIIVQPNVDELRRRAPRTMGELYEEVRRDINEALRDKPDYVKHYDFCLTAREGDGFAELVTTGMGDPSPLRNPFDRDLSYSRMRGSPAPAPWAKRR